MTFLSSVGKMAFGVICVAVLWEYLGPYLLRTDELAYGVKTFDNAVRDSVELFADHLRALSKIAQENRMALELLLKSADTGPQHPAREDGTGGEKRV